MLPICQLPLLPHSSSYGAALARSRLRAPCASCASDLGARNNEQGAQTDQAETSEQEQGHSFAPLGLVRPSGGYQSSSRESVRPFSLGSGYGPHGLQTVMELAGAQPFV